MNTKPGYESTSKPPFVDVRVGDWLWISEHLRGLVGEMQIRAIRGTRDGDTITVAGRAYSGVHRDDYSLTVSDYQSGSVRYLGQRPADEPPSGFDADIKLLAERMHAAASENGMCSIYDTVVTAVNRELKTFQIPERTTKYRLTVTVDVPMSMGTTTDASFRQLVSETFEQRNLTAVLDRIDPVTRPS